MDAAGVGAQLVYPNVIGFGGQQMMAATEDADLRLWHVQAYNDAVLDLQKESHGRIFPQAALPLWDLDASLQELHRARKNGLTGVVMSNAPAHFGQPPLTHPDWEPFFAHLPGSGAADQLPRGVRQLGGGPLQLVGPEPRADGHERRLPIRR